VTVHVFFLHDPLPPLSILSKPHTDNNLVGSEAQSRQDIARI
jgi:hypothetical protein